MYYLIFSKEKIIQETHKVPFPFLTCKYELKASLGKFFFFPTIVSFFKQFNLERRFLPASHCHERSQSFAFAYWVCLPWPAE